MRPPALRFEMLDDAMVNLLRTKTPAERLAISNGMWRSARRMIEAILRKEHPVQESQCRFCCPVDLLRVCFRESRRQWQPG